MKKILIGLLLVVVPIPWGGVNLMPAFLGYVLIFLGLGRGWKSESLAAGRTIAVASAALTAALWVAALLGYGMAFPLERFLQLLMGYRLLIWCEEQDEWDWGWRIGRLRLSWYAWAGAAAASILLGIFDGVLRLVWAVAALAAALYYIYTFYRLSRLVPREEQR